jgi:hypothetical protein
MTWFSLSRVAARLLPVLLSTTAWYLSTTVSLLITRLFEESVVEKETLNFSVSIFAISESVIQYVSVSPFSECSFRNQSFWY